MARNASSEYADIAGSPVEPILRALADAALLVDTEGRVIATEEDFVELAGRDAATWPGTLISEILPQWPGAIDGVRTWRDRLVRADRSTLDVTVTAVPYTSGSGPALVLMRVRSHGSSISRDAMIEGLQALIDLVPGYLFAKDGDGRFLFVNRAVARAFGCEPEQVIGRTDVDFGIPEPTAAAYRASDRAVVESGRPWTVEKEYLVHPDGTQGWYQTTKVPFRDPVTGQLAVLGLATDITRRVEAEARLARECALARLLMRLATDFINCPSDAVDAATNRALAELGTFVGVDRAYVFTYDFERGICTNTHEWCADEITPEIQSLQAVPLALISTWIEHHRRGEPIVVGEVCRHTAPPLRAELERQGIQSLIVMPMPGHPDPLGFVGFDAVRAPRSFSEDELALLRVFAEMLASVRARLATQHLLELERRRLSDIMEATGAGIWEWDITSGQIRINDQAVRRLGYAPEEVNPITIRTWENWVHPEDGSIAIELFRRHAVDPTNSFQVQTRLRHRDGHFISVLTQGRITSRDEDGRPTWMSGTYLDVTARLEIEQALRESEERFRLLFQDVPSVAVQGFGPDFNILFWNRGSETLYGYTATEAIGRSLVELLVAAPKREATAKTLRR